MEYRLKGDKGRQFKSIESNTSTLCKNEKTKLILESIKKENMKDYILLIGHSQLAGIQSSPDSLISLESSICDVITATG